MENSIVLGVDVGGTHVTSALVNVHLGAIVEGSQNRLSLNSNGIANEILDTIENCIRISAGSHLLQHMSLGFAMPGPFDYENGICKIVQQEKFRSLYELPLKEILSQRLKLPQNAIYFMNDACSFLEGELLGGSLKAVKSAVLGLTLGTGLGSAFRRETEIEDAELWCSSFEEKTAEDYLSTRWFARRFTELTQTQVAGVKEMMLQKNFAAETRQVFEQFAGNLARLIYQQCAAHGYTHVVLGGNIMQARPAFHDQLLFNLTQLGTEVQIKYAVLGEDAALLGSAGMAWRKTYYR